MLIRVTQLVDTDDLDHDDQQDLPAGEDGKGSVHDYEVPEHYRDEEEALNWFHDHVGIACLDDFEIQVLDTCTGCKELTWAGGEDGLCGDCLHARDQRKARGVIEEYRGYEITVAPAHQREYRFNYTHKDYEGPEDRRCGAGRSIDDCKESIDEIEHELSVACASCGEDASRDAEDGLCDSCLKARMEHDIRMTDDPIYAASVREREQAERERDRGEWTEHYGAD